MELQLPLLLLIEYIYFIHSFIHSFDFFSFFFLVRALYLFDMMAKEVERKGRPQIWFINLFSLQPFNVFLIFRYNVLALLSIFDTFFSIFSVVLFVILLLFHIFCVYLVTKFYNARYALMGRNWFLYVLCGCLISFGSINLMISNCTVKIKCYVFRIILCMFFFFLFHSTRQQLFIVSLSNLKVMCHKYLIMTD